MSIEGTAYKRSSPHSCVDFTVAVLGNATSNPTVPADGNFTPTTGTYPRRANKVSTASGEGPTRASAGVYVITIKPKLALLFAKGEVYAGGGSPTGAFKVAVTKIDAANRKLYVSTTNLAGTATDIGTSDLLVLYVHAQDSGV